MERRYEATHLSKTATEDNYAKGLIGDWTVCIDEKVQFSDPTLEGLIEKLAKHADCPKDHVFADGDDPVTFLEFSRQENEQGLEPNEYELAEFRAGTINLWSTTYRYDVRCVEEVPITWADLKGMGIAPG